MKLEDKLEEGLEIVQLEERLEMVQLATASAAGSLRCDSSDSDAGSDDQYN